MKGEGVEPSSFCLREWGLDERPVSYTHLAADHNAGCGRGAIADNRQNLIYLHRDRVSSRGIAAEMTEDAGLYLSLIHIYEIDHCEGIII